MLEPNPRALLQLCQLPDEPVTGDRKQVPRDRDRACLQSLHQPGLRSHLQVGESPGEHRHFASLPFGHRRQSPLLQNLEELLIGKQVHLAQPPEQHCDMLRLKVLGDHQRPLRKGIQQLRLQPRDVGCWLLAPSCPATRVRPIRIWCQVASPLPRLLGDLQQESFFDARECPHHVRHLLRREIIHDNQRPRLEGLDQRTRHDHPHLRKHPRQVRHLLRLNRPG
mmetsp:Transcript_55150/g.130915  ORF Transcript_55150/g.130915 Transcript_55150/m.130915 type:complete len:223 (-) Transcript_55150:184-852(-)